MQPVSIFLKIPQYKRFLSRLVLALFVPWCVAPPAGWSQQIGVAMDMVSPVMPVSAQALLTGLIIDPADPFRFQLLFNPKTLSEEDLRRQAERAAGYFLAGLTLPADEIWVNLSPYEKDRMTGEALRPTKLGLDLLAEDYILKQATASLLNPDDVTGRRFWKKVYSLAAEKGIGGDIPVETFNKVWIVPDDAAVYEHDRAVVITRATLTVKLDKDHRLSRGRGLPAPSAGGRAADEQASELARQVMREVVLPVLQEEINHSERFAALRQIYRSMILAAWFKHTLKQHLLQRLYVDQRKTLGLRHQNPQAVEDIFHDYIEAFRQGAYDFIRTEIDPASQRTVLRRYMIGGTRLGVKEPPKKGKPPAGSILKSFVAALVALGTVAGGERAASAGSSSDAATLVLGPAVVQFATRYTLPTGFEQADENARYLFAVLIAGLSAEFGIKEPFFDDSPRGTETMLARLHHAVMAVDDGHPLWETFRWLTGQDDRKVFAEWVSRVLTEAWRFIQNASAENLRLEAGVVEPAVDRGEWEWLLGYFDDNPAAVMLEAARDVAELKHRLDAEGRGEAFVDLFHGLARDQGQAGEKGAVNDDLLRALLIGMANWLYTEPPDALKSRSYSVRSPSWMSRGAAEPWILRLNPHESSSVDHLRYFIDVLYELQMALTDEGLRSLIRNRPVEVLYLIKSMASVSESAVSNGENPERTLRSATLGVWRDVLGGEALEALYQHPDFFLVYREMTAPRIWETIDRVEGFAEFVDDFNRAIGLPSGGLKRWLSSKLRRDSSVLGRRTAAEWVIRFLILPYITEQQDTIRAAERLRLRDQASSAGAADDWLDEQWQAVRTEIEQSWKGDTNRWFILINPVNPVDPFLPPARIPPLHIEGRERFGGINPEGFFITVGPDGSIQAGVRFIHDDQEKWVPIPVPRPYQFLPSPPRPRPYQFLPSPPKPRPYQFLPSPPRPRPPHQPDHSNPAVLGEVWRVSVADAGGPPAPIPLIPFLGPFLIGMTGRRAPHVSSTKGTTRADREDPPGGIDFRPEGWEVMITSSGDAVTIPTQWDTLTPDDIPGLVPVILEISPVVNLPQLLGLGQGGNNEPPPGKPMALKRDRDGRPSPSRQVPIFTTGGPGSVYIIEASSPVDA